MVDGPTWIYFRLRIVLYNLIISLKTIFLLFNIFVKLDSVSILLVYSRHWMLGKQNIFQIVL